MPAQSAAANVIGAADRRKTIENIAVRLLVPGRYYH
jgi:hypothetical protein